MLLIICVLLDTRTNFLTFYVFLSNTVNIVFDCLTKVGQVRDLRPTTRMELIAVHMDSLMTIHIIISLPQSTK